MKVSLRSHGRTAPFQARDLGKPSCAPGFSDSPDLGNSLDTTRIRLQNARSAWDLLRSNGRIPGFTQVPRKASVAAFPGSSQKVRPCTKHLASEVHS